MVGAPPPCGLLSERDAVILGGCEKKNKSKALLIMSLIRSLTARAKCTPMRAAAAGLHGWRSRLDAHMDEFFLVITALSPNTIHEASTPSILDHLRAEERNQQAFSQHRHHVVRQQQTTATSRPFPSSKLTDSALHSWNLHSVPSYLPSKRKFLFNTRATTSSAAPI